ncbi:hypothetical protein BLNAU_2193 [Blattamonas nauphoetae]|uniref:Cyclin N-terminal domain-containing protein n=1 Tax=Blattamonas nauphoetae TaxID=2049346 RepID=A0ABQ9YGB6_9EUKA|nr:hypothetical protein BLNAU_2193 [Blattamonas nauphoetae]
MAPTSSIPITLDCHKTTPPPINTTPEHGLSISFIPVIYHQKRKRSRRKQPVQQINQIPSLTHEDINITSRKMAQLVIDFFSRCTHDPSRAVDGSKNDWRTSITQLPGVPSVETLAEDFRVFFTYLDSTIKFQVAEIVYTCIYLMDLISNESGQITPLVLKPRSLGTALLISSMLAVKMLRDRCGNNSWWAESFEVDLELVNRSERAFLMALNYRVYPDLERYTQTHRWLFGIQNC